MSGDDIRAEPVADIRAEPVADIRPPRAVTDAAAARHVERHGAWRPDIDIEELRRLAKAATVGPWAVGKNKRWGIFPVTSTTAGWHSAVATVPHFEMASDPMDAAGAPDAAYIAAANPTTVLALLDQLAALRAAPEPGLRARLAEEVVEWRKGVKQRARPEDKEADEGYAAGLGRAIFAVEELLAARTPTEDPDGH